MRFRGYTLTKENNYMNEKENKELMQKLKELQEEYDINVNPRHHKLENNRYLVSVDINVEGQGTFIKLFLAKNKEYKLYRRMKTYKELA